MVSSDVFFFVCDLQMRESEIGLWYAVLGTRYRIMPVTASRKPHAGIQSSDFERNNDITK
jgi:hypothetical protein